MAYQAFSFTGSGQSGGILAGRAGIGINVSISGTFVGTVGLYRQLPGDSTSTWRLVAAYTVPTETSVIEWENGASYQLQCTAYTSGTAVGRIGQGL